MSEMRVLITGGSGFVGLAVAEAVIRHGGVPILLADRMPPAALLAAVGAGVETQLADVRDGEALARVIAACRPSHIVHGAALTPGPSAEIATAETLLTVNVAGTAALMKAAVGVGRVLLLSSVAVYGPLPPGPGVMLDEERPPAPVALYGISKVAAEQVALRLADRLGIELAIARLGPVVGPFEYETGVRGVMSPPLQMLRSAAAGQDVTLAWRLAADWVYSRDVAEGVLSLLRAERLTRRLFNVGSGVVTDMLAWGAELARAYPGWRCRLAEPGETPSVVYGLSEERALVATARLAAETGFVARYDLPRAVADHVAWQRALRRRSP